VPSDTVLREHAGAAADAHAAAQKMPHRLARRDHRGLPLVIIGEMPLPPNAFVFLGEEYPVPAVFQIWQRQPFARIPSRILRKHADFDFVTRPEADLAFQRVGVRAGAIKHDFAAVADASHFFIRARLLSPEILASRLKALEFSEIRLRTAGNPSISKSELIGFYAARHGETGDADVRSCSSSRTAGA